MNLHSSFNFRFSGVAVNDRGFLNRETPRPTWRTVVQEKQLSTSLYDDLLRSCVNDEFFETPLLGAGHDAYPEYRNDGSRSCTVARDVIIKLDLSGIAQCKRNLGFSKRAHGHYVITSDHSRRGLIRSASILNTNARARYLHTRMHPCTYC